MKITSKIAITELQTLFYSPVAWLILIVFTFQSAMTFTSLFGGYVQNQEMNYVTFNITYNLFGGYRGLFTTAQEYLYLYIPLLTMALMSRETSSGSIKLLYASPVRNCQIILGKYLSMMLYGLVMMAILFVFVIWAGCTVKDFDYPLAFSGMLGLYLLTCTYAAIGLFMSSLTSYQVVAAVGTLATLAVLNFIGRVGQEQDLVREITYWLSISGRANESINGLICSEDVLYFVIVSALFLALSILRLKAARQKARWTASLAKYAAAFLLAFTLGYLSSRPRLMAFHDATRTKQRTLTKNSQEIIKRATGGLNMTVYVNALEGNLSNGLPRNRKYDMERFEQYIRFKPEMKVKYVYYYANTGDPMLARRYPGLGDERVVGQISKAMSLDSTMFTPAANLTVDLEPEAYRMTRLLERDGGQKTFLRMFDDIQRYPGETEISAALKRLVTYLPVIGFVTGHGERDFNNEGDRGYFRFSRDKPFRYALINQGFNFEEVRLDKPIPEHVYILVIADPREPFTPAERARLDGYIERGGNLLVAGDTRRQKVMNPLVEKLGVRFMPGQLVKSSGGARPAGEEPASFVIPQGTMYFPGLPKSAKNDYLADFIISRPTPEAGAFSHILQSLYLNELVATMPGCVGLEYDTGKGFDVTPLFVSDTIDSWNELETTDFIDDEPRVNPAIGEVERSYPTAIALARPLFDEREQRIVILGDADCLSNGEISMQRSNLPASNYNMIMGCFSWMSDNEVPIDTRRPVPPDNRFHVTGTGVKASKYALMGAFPLLLLAGCLLIWLRRRGR